METCRPCGCKGIRTCLLCEQEFGISKTNSLNKSFGTYVYCAFCNLAWPGWELNDYLQHPNHVGEPLEYPGVYIKLNFLSEKEEKVLLEALEQIPWDLSQSGRRKQNFGPKCNFKKRRIRVGEFKGFPESTRFVQEKFADEVIMNGFQTIEQCTLEYDPKRGASIDPHIDDCWIWGERIVTVNLLSDSILTMTNNLKPNSYNLKEVREYPSVMKGDGNAHEIKNNLNSQPVIRIPMPKRSLLVIYGAARYEWEHQVLRDDISERRVCLAYREFTPPYLEGGKYYEDGKDVLNKAKIFF